MPGKISLEINEYYGYKYNVFWKIIFDIFKTDYSNSYKIKQKLLKDNKTALWDTLKHCKRTGSLDSNIKNEEVNNFETFFSVYSNIKHILFNGKASHNYFKKYVGFNDDFSYYIMPSTSPANAGKTYEEKLSEWRVIKSL